jgi:hypothetical protein
MTEAAALPRQIVDQLRTERGGIVDFAIQTGRIVEQEGKVSQHESNSNKGN